MLPRRPKQENPASTSGALNPQLSAILSEAITVAENRSEVKTAGYFKKLMLLVEHPNGAVSRVPLIREAYSPTTTGGQLSSIHESVSNHQTGQLAFLNCDPDLREQYRIQTLIGLALNPSTPTEVEEALQHTPHSAVATALTAKQRFRESEKVEADMGQGKANKSLYKPLLPHNLPIDPEHDPNPDTAGIWRNQPYLWYQLKLLEELNREVVRLEGIQSLLRGQEQLTDEQKLLNLIAPVEHQIWECFYILRRHYDLRQFIRTAAAYGAPITEELLNDPEHIINKKVKQGFRFWKKQETVKDSLPPIEIPLRGLQPPQVPDMLVSRKP